MNDKYYAEEEDFQDNHRGFAGNLPLKNNEIKYKKRNIPIDREQLYAQNLELKNRIKDLMELNLKMKTQLSITEKEKLNLCNIAEEEAFHPKIAPRSQSGNHKKSLANILPQHQHNVQSLFNNPLSKEKQSMAFKKMLRDQKLEIEKLNNQNQRLKKTMKYTRMNEIMAENKELLDETIRLKAIIAENKQAENQTYTEYSNQIENLKRKLALEKDSEKRNGYQLKKQLEVVNELREKLRDSETKKIDMEKRLNKEIKQLKSDISQVRSRQFQQVAIKTRDCDKEQCIKMKKERMEAKKKVEQLEKEVKRLKDEIESFKKRSFQRDYDNKKAPESTISKNIENTNNRISNPSTETKKDESKVSAQVDASHKREQSAVRMNQFELAEVEESRESKVSNSANVVVVEKQSQKPAEKAAQKPVEKPIQKPVEKLEEKAVAPAQERKPSQKKIEPSKLAKQEQHKKDISDSMDTDKLLESLDKVQNSKVQEVKVLKPDTKSSKNLLQNVQQAEAEEQYKQDSDGEYEELNYEEFEEPDEPEVKKEKEPEIKKSEKSEKKIKDTVDKKQKEEKPKKKDGAKEGKEAKDGKQKQKSKKKLDVKHDSDEEVLYKSEEKQQNKKSKEENDDGKIELKIIKDTLIYKFMAQRYTYEDFCNDITNSDIKQFSITQIMNLLGEEPFLLTSENIETIIIYLFESNEITGEETISTKNFMKKMKKFVGKCKLIDEEADNQNIEKICEIVEKDEQGSCKIRKKCKELDSGDGTLTKQNFVKIMGQFNIKNETLETALSQVVLVSDDITRLNYDLFLKRFSGEDQ